MRDHGTFARAVADLPPGEHWAILEFGSITIPGDERSRQAPGHGYPEHTETTLSYEFFTDEAKFKAALQERYQSKYTGTRSQQTVLGVKVSEVWRAQVTIGLTAVGLTSAPRA